MPHIHNQHHLLPRRVGQHVASGMALKRSATTRLGLLTRSASPAAEPAAVAGASSSTCVGRSAVFKNVLAPSPQWVYRNLILSKISGPQEVCSGQRCRSNTTQV